MIKHKIRDSIIWGLDKTGAVARYRARCASHGPLVCVLAFHDVPDGAWFESVVRMLKDEYHVLTPKEFDERRFNKEKINVLLTFDDGYQSWTDTVLPALREHNMTGLFFVCSGLLDAAGNDAAVETFMQNRLRIRPRKPLTWELASRIHEEGHAFGGHTVNHADLGRATAETVRSEVAGDKARLEEKLHETLTHFAYPFGRREHMSDASRMVIKEAGYTHVFSAETGFVSAEDVATIIPRTLIETCQPLPSIRRWVEGGYDIFRRLRNSM